MIAATSNDGVWLFVVLTGWVVLATCGWIIENLRKGWEHRAWILSRRERQLADREATIEKQTALLTQARADVEQLSREKALGFPWLATAYSDYLQLLDNRIADVLEQKKHPAIRSADALRTIAAEKAALRKENKILRELHRYYEALFPWLIDFKGEELDALIYDVTHRNEQQSPADQDHDPATEWLTPAEFNSPTLSRAEKYQRALDRYWSRRKTPWQIGRDYERYIGFLHEQKGFRVEYYGIAQGVEDLGRDLICRSDTEVRLIQCKCWAAEKTIHEKHICQLVGTSLVYWARAEAEGTSRREPKLTSWLYTSCAVSPTAMDFARLAGVNVVQNFALAKYPVIKCNVSRRDRAKIYHLPFDQQYDRTAIEFKDECYVATVAEAEQRGFRRAYRWHGHGKSAA